MPVNRSVPQPTTKLVNAAQAINRPSAVGIRRMGNEVIECGTWDEM